MIKQIYYEQHIGIQYVVHNKFSHIQWLQEILRQECQINYLENSCCYI